MRSSTMRTNTNHNHHGRTTNVQLPRQQQQRGVGGGGITPNVAQRLTGSNTSTGIPTNQSRNVVTPAAITSVSSGRSMTVDKQIVDELLLVCGVIGTTTKVPSTSHHTDHHGEDRFTIVPVTDCVQWLQDLQRCLRRDDDVTRPISILLHSWNILVQKLLPLVYHTQYDTTLIITICKIIVLLTKPLHTQTIMAGRMMIHTKPSSTNHITEAVLKEQIKLRDNALQQASILMDYKRAFCHFGGGSSSASSSSTTTANRTSHRPPKRNGLFAIFVALLAEPLSRVGNARTDNDHLTIELIIYLFRNLLIAEPILNTSGTSTLRSSSSNTNDIHYELITIFDQELVLDILYVLCADIEQRENVSYNLLLMELIQLLFKHQNPMLIATSHVPGHSSTNPSSHPPTSVSRPPLVTTASGSDKNSLLRSIQREKQTIQSCSTSRHSHFGGTIVLENKSNGQKQLVGASLFNTNSSSTTLSSTTTGNGNSSMTQQQQLLLLSRRKNKNLEPFIGAKKNYHHSVVTTTSGGTTTTTNGNPYVSSWHKKSMQTLHQFCTIFVLDQKCYGPLMKSLKNEFRRDSVRLEDNDRIVYFQVVTFFCTWYRTNLKIQQLNVAVPEDSYDDCIGLDHNSVTSSPSSIGQLIFTMDVFSFNLVLNATDTFQEHKKYGPLSHAVALLREMMHLLDMMMQNSSTGRNQNLDVTANATEQIMAMGLMDRLFYASEPLDRLPKLLSRWTPGTSTREYVCDLVEITHMTLQVLETNAKLCRRSATDTATNNNEDSTKHDTVAKMKAMAIEFDIESYFVRKLVSNHTITMYTHLMSCYAINTPEINQYILSFLERVRNHVLSTPSDDVDIDADDDDDDLVMKNPFTPKIVTMEPMLYNAQLFIVLNNVLNDTSIRTDSNFTGLIEFATTMVNNFAMAAQSNPVLFVEVLFKHPSPHRFCDMVTNCYVTEDLRMLVERDILLQQQYQLEQEVEAFANNQDNPEEESGPLTTATRMTTSASNTNSNDRDDNSESSDEELEFTDEPLNDEPILGKRTVPKSTNHHDDDDDDDDDTDVSKRARTKSILSDSDDE